MNRSFRILLSLATAGLLVGTLAAVRAEEPFEKPSRQILMKKDVDLPSPRITANVMRVVFPAGGKAPTHTHPGPGPRYLIKGKLKVIDGGETKIYTAGDVFWETGHEMMVENVAGSDSELVIFEMAPRP